MDSEKEWPLERRCEFVSRLYWLWYSGLMVAILAERGEDVLIRWSYEIIRNHQGIYFLEGLRKLGIDPDREPPAIVAAKYHYFSNALGGIDMKYVEESPTRAWIRYDSPFPPPGPGWIAIPPEAGRVQFAAWHANNATLLNRPRLGFVLARGLSEGEPYAEGYFQEYDHDLAPQERIRYDTTATMPEFDPIEAPALDPEVWPLERQVKAKRNYTRGYVEGSIRTLLQMFGLQATTRIVERAFSGIAVQHGRELLSELNICSGDALGLALFTRLLGDMAGDTTEIASPSPTKHIVRRSHRRLFPPGQAPAEVHHAMFSFTSVMARIMGPRIRASLVALQDTGAPHDEMVFEDVII